jgi:hypothetical protein
MEITPSTAQLCLLTVNYEWTICLCGSHPIHLRKQLRHVAFCIAYQ